MPAHKTPHPLERRIRAANAGGRLALIPFLTALFPDGPRFWQALAELEDTGADIIEIGVPFSDPVADGPVIEEASRRVLAAGFSLPGFLDELAAWRKSRPARNRAELVLMGYYNPFLHYGCGADAGARATERERLERLGVDAAQAGIGGCIIPDLPAEEAGPAREALGLSGVALIPLVGLNTDARRLALYAEQGQGYVYAVSVLGVTGERPRGAANAGAANAGESRADSAGVAALIARVRRQASLPVALGFGLSRPEQVAALPPSGRPDAVIFGSALVRHLDTGGSAAGFLAPWRAADKKMLQ